VDDDGVEVTVVVLSGEYLKSSLSFLAGVEALFILTSFSRSLDDLEE
jgi:hypothetical protein